MGDGLVTTAEDRRIRRQERRRQRLVTLYTLAYDDARHEYIRTESRVARGRLPLDAVHLTGEKDAYMLDLVRAGKAPEGLTAVDLNLWLLNNDINDALATKWSMTGDDIKKYIVYGIAAIVMVCVIWTFI